MCLAACWAAMRRGSGRELTQCSAGCGRSSACAAAVFYPMLMWSVADVRKAAGERSKQHDLCHLVRPTCSQRCAPVPPPPIHHPWRRSCAGRKRIPWQWARAPNFMGSGGHNYHWWHRRRRPMGALHYLNHRTCQPWRSSVQVLGGPLMKQRSRATLLVTAVSQGGTAHFNTWIRVERFKRILRHAAHATISISIDPKRS